MIKAEIFKMPEIIEPSAITTAGHYILISHLVRPLLKLDKNGSIKGDLANTWFCSKDKKIWTIEIKKANFSNGEIITAIDVVNSLERQIKLETAVHFPFDEIQKVIAKNENTIEIRLAHPRTDFIYDLTKPEFGVLHKTDIMAQKNKCNFSITSGPYSLQKKEANSYFLKHNANYDEDVENKHDLILQDSSASESLTKLIDNKIDFFSSQESIAKEKHLSALKKDGVVAIKPHIGFSFWISINPESTYFKDSKNRSSFQMLFNEYTLPAIDNFFWEKAYQLYLPDGDGRLNKNELNEIWQKIKRNAIAQTKTSKKTHLRVLPLKIDNVVTLDILEKLKQHFEVEVIKYKSEEELIKIIKAGSFDCKIQSNDFSSIDLSENLKTTFNKSRPYIFLGEFQYISKLLNQSFEVEDRKLKSEFYKKIAQGLLLDGLIVPIAYLRIYFYTSNKFEITRWSTLYPEIAMWKVKIQD